jgi:hypothetical protein
LKALGHKFVFENFELMEFKTYEDAEAYVLSTNFHRRQVSAAQRRQIITDLIVKYPKAGNRELSRVCGINHVTIGNVRNEMKNPRDKKSYEEFVNQWRGFLTMSDKWQVAFAPEFEVELRDLQELAKA